MANIQGVDVCDPTLALLAGGYGDANTGYRWIERAIEACDVQQSARIVPTEHQEEVGCVSRISGTKDGTSAPRVEGQATHDIEAGKGIKARQMIVIGRVWGARIQQIAAMSWEQESW